MMITVVVVMSNNTVVDHGDSRFQDGSKNNTWLHSQAVKSLPMGMLEDLACKITLRTASITWSSHGRHL